MLIKLIKDDKSKPKLFIDLRTLKQAEDSPLLPGQNYYIHKIPRFPEWMKGKTYRYADHKMDLYNLKCDCNSQLEKRELYSGRDVRTLCKHLYFKILKTSAAREIDSLTFLLIRSAVLWGESHLYRYTYLGKEIILGFKENVDWTNVYSENKYNPEEYHRYSFNPITNRWSYDNPPEYGYLVPDLIKRIIQFQLPFEHKYIMKLKLDGKD